MRIVIQRVKYASCTVDGVVTGKCDKGLLLFIGFSIYDFTLYNETYSAPFSAYVLVRFLMFGVPAIIVFLIAYLLKKKGR